MERDKKEGFGVPGLVFVPESNFFSRAPIQILPRKKGGYRVGKPEEA